MNKKKIALLAMSLCMIAILAVGGSLAYLTDQDSQTNTFTAGQVGIVLDEAIVVEDPKTDNLVAAKPEDVEDGIIRTPVEMTEQDYKLHPNMTVCKDPTITVDSDSEDCYVGAIITITGNSDEGSLLELLELKDSNGLIDIRKLASGGLVDESSEYVGPNWNGFQYAFESNTAVVCQEFGEGDQRILYVFIKKPQTSKSDPIVLFNTLTIPAKYDNHEMAILNGMEIDVQAYAVQSAGFEYLGEQKACYAAMTEAFGNVWPGDQVFEDKGVLRVQK